MACGDYHTSYVKTDGTLWATGSNNNGQLGDGTITEQHSPKPIILRIACLYTDGVDDYYKTAPFALVQPESVYRVGSMVAWSSGKYLFDGNATNSGAVVMTTSTPQLNLNAGSSAAANTDLAVATTGVLGAVFNGASSSLCANNKAATTGSAGAGNMNGLTVAASGTIGNYANLTESELIVRSTADTPALQLRHAAYLMRKYGIAP